MRSPHQQARAFTDPLTGDFEALAGRVVARLTGAPVVIQDDNSRDAMPDLRIDYPRRVPGYAEVWRDIEPGYAAMFRKVAGPREISAARLGRIWWVTLSGAAPVDQLVRELPDLVAQMDAAGEKFEIVPPRGALAQSDSPRVRRAVQLGVVEFASRPTRDGENGTIFLCPDGVYGPSQVDWEAFLKWVEDCAAGPRAADNRRKLAATRADERHLIIGATFTSPGEAFFALSESTGVGAVPPRAPNLPSEITHVWVLPAQSAGRCLVWFPDRGWLDTMQHWATG